MKKTDTPENAGSGHSPFSFFPSSFIVVFGVAIYLVLFFATPFEPYRSPAGDCPSRFFFFSYLLLPDEYFGSWFGPDGEFSLWDRLPILLTAALCLLAAISLGAIIIAGKFKDLADSLSMLEFPLLSIVFGLGIFSVLISLLYFFGDSHTLFIRGFTCFIAFCYCPFLLSRVNAFFRQWSGKSPVQDRRPNGEATNYVRRLKGVLPVFAVLLILGGMIPSTDYDVLAYHLAGTRTFFEAGRIGFVPNDVYANMPFGAEMFFLWGMALTGNVFSGAMVGKTIIAATTVITALGIYAFGRRFFSESAGLIGMFLYMTTPWIFYVSTAGLVDTVVGMYAFFAIYAVFLTVPIQDRRLNFLAGFFAGSAAACKYPAMLFVVFPIGAFLFLKSRGRRYSVVPGLTPLLIFVLAVAISCGGWYVKNWYFTGNPVYPLCYSIFGDSTGTWTPETDARWTANHSPHGFGPSRFLHDFLSVALTSPWNGPLTIPLAILGVIIAFRAKTQSNKIVFPLLGWLVFFFAAWWLLTHRIDRFWLPAVPVLCVLAGLGGAWNTDKIRCRALIVLMTISTVYCFLASGAPAPGKLNRYFVSLDSMRKDSGVSTPWAVWFHLHPPEGKILLVGESKAFLYDVPVLYNSCWNETPLKAIVESGIESGNPREEFRRRDIALILVDWSEIRRFREPGNYGYSDFVRQDVFDRLVAEGVLERYCPTEELAKSPTAVYRVSGGKNE